MTFSILWIVLASTVTVIALMRTRYSPNASALKHSGDGQSRQPGQTLTVLGVIYSLVLLAGFLYIGWQHSLEFMK
jgi:hypothetical protein